MKQPGNYQPHKWTITKAGGAWWAECPDDDLRNHDCLCESFDTQAEALAHVTKHTKDSK